MEDGFEHLPNIVRLIELIILQRSQLLSAPCHSKWHLSDETTKVSVFCEKMVVDRKCCRPQLSAYSPWFHDSEITYD